MIIGVIVASVVSEMMIFRLSFLYCPHAGRNRGSLRSSEHDKRVSRIGRYKHMHFGERSSINLHSNSDSEFKNIKYGGRGVFHDSYSRCTDAKLH